MINRLNLIMITLKSIIVVTAISTVIVTANPVNDMEIGMVKNNNSTLRNQMRIGNIQLQENENGLARYKHFEATKILKHDDIDNDYKRKDVNGKEPKILKRNRKKFPIRRPKLRFSVKPKTKKHKWAYASAVKIRQVTPTNNANLTGYGNNTFFKRKSVLEDILMLSSSERNVEHLHLDGGKADVYKRIRYRKIPISSFNLTASAATSYGVRKVPKLLLPKPSRPAMYSLHGFIPKPNSQRITTSTTVAPTTHRYGKTQHKEKPEKNLSKKSRRKYGLRTRSKAYDESNDLNTSGSINRKTFSKRRGALYTSRRTSDHGNRDVTAHKTQSTTAKKYGNKYTTRYTLKKKKGTPGVDYPTFKKIPKTTFNCTNMARNGMYADPETGCQVWHMCQGIQMHSFLCPNGTIFSEKAGVCDWWYNVQCNKPVDQPLLALDPRKPGKIFKSKFYVA